MSTETSELNQPNAGGDSGAPRRRFGFRHADTGVDEDGADRDSVTTDVDAGRHHSRTTVDDTTVDDTTVVPASVQVSDPSPASASPLPQAADFDPNAPLLGNAVGLRASWQQTAAEFVDDPRVAVVDAAELVEHTTQTLIGALQQRLRQLRGQWENRTAAGVSGSAATAGEASGAVATEELRHLMQSYRALFNQITNS